MKYILATFIVLLVIGTMVFPSVAQEELAVISAENAENLELLTRWERGSVLGLSWLDGNTLVVRSSTGRWVHDITNPEAEPEPTELPFSLSLQDDGFIFVDNSTGETVSTLEGASSAALFGHFSPDNTFFVGAGGNIAHVWEVASGAEIAVLEHDADVSRTLFNSDSSMLFVNTTLAESSHSQAVLWDLDTGTSIWSDFSTFMLVQSAAFTDDGSTLVVSGYYNERGTVPQWGSRLVTVNVETGDASREQFSNDTNQHNAMSFAHDGSILARAAGSSVNLLDPTVPDQSTPLTGEHVFNIEELAFNPSDTLLASSDRSDVRIWDLSTGEVVVTLHGYADRVEAAFSPDGEILAAGMGYRVQFRDGLSGDLLDDLETDSSVSFEFNATSSHLMITQRRNYQLWSVSDAQIVWSSDEYESGLASPDLTTMAASNSAYDNNDVYLIDMTTGEEIMTLSSGDNGTSGSAFDADSALLAIGYDNGEVIVWDVATGEQRTILDTDLDWPGTICFSPNGELLAVGESASPFDEGSTAIVEIWNLSTGERLLTIDTEYGASLVSLIFSLQVEFVSDEVLLTALNYRLHYWDVNTGEILLALDNENTLGGVRTYEFSPDRSLLVTGERFSFAIRDAMTGEVISTHSLHNGYVSNLVFNPDGTILVTGGTDGTLAMWRVQN